MRGPRNRGAEQQLAPRRAPHASAGSVRARLEPIELPMPSPIEEHGKNQRERVRRGAEQQRQLPGPDHLGTKRGHP